MVDENRVRRLLAMLERYRALLAVDDPDRPSQPRDRR
jgi:hypothetical protein